MDINAEIIESSDDEDPYQRDYYCTHDPYMVAEC